MDGCVGGECLVERCVNIMILVGKLIQLPVSVGKEKNKTKHHDMGPESHYCVNKINETVVEETC